MGHRPCPVCRSAAVRSSIFGGYHYLQKHYDIVRCGTCGLFFVDPLPDRDILMEVYRSSQYFEEYVSPGSGPDSLGYLASFESPNEYDEMTLSLIARYCPDGRLLDVGCAGGRFLARAKEAGYEVLGLEPNAWMASHASDVLGVKVFEGTLEDAGDVFGPSCFDVVHLADVLEHLRDIHEALDDIRCVLREGGLLVLQQPLTYNTTLFNLMLKLNMGVKKDRHSQYAPLHLWEFTPSTLRRALRGKGFEVLHFRTFESKPKDIPRSKEWSVKKRIGFWVKAVSSVVSNSWIGASFELGDRAVVLCRKR